MSLIDIAKEVEALGYNLEAWSKDCDDVFYKLKSFDKELKNTNIGSLMEEVRILNTEIERLKKEKEFMYNAGYEKGKKDAEDGIRSEAWQKGFKAGKKASEFFKD